MATLIIPAILSWVEPVTWAEPASQETIFLVMRHGETYGNNSADQASYTYTGCQTNFSLNENGTAQAELIATKISILHEQEKLKISAIYASPLTRAIQTATPIATALDLPIATRPDLREINWGIADGRLVSEMDQQWDSAEEIIEKQNLSREKKWDLLPVFPEAEKFNQVLNRVTSQLQRIAEHHKGQVVLIATHGRVVKCLTAAALDKDDNSIPYPKNAGIAVFRYSEGKPLEFIEVRDNR